MRITSILFLVTLANAVYCQLPETDIFLCSIQKNDSLYVFSQPENITKRIGYDNQPCFSHDSKRLYFVSVRDTAQSDIYYYDTNKKFVAQFTNTSTSEYSPDFSPNPDYLSVVRVDADSGQRFYLLSKVNPEKTQLVTNTDSIGYYCWVNDSMLAMFILGPPFTLQILNIQTKERRLIASDIGRCMKMAPDGKSMYFVLKANDSEWYLYSMDTRTFSLTRIVNTLPGSEDFAVFPDGTIIMGYEGKLYRLRKNGAWEFLADFSGNLQGFYRIALNSKGNLLALVAYTGKKP